MNVETQAYLRSAIHSLLLEPRYSEKGRLLRHGAKVFSQADEDGILAEIFHRIGNRGRTFVEFGVGNGLECNSAWLVMQGWRGLWIEQAHVHCEAIRKSFSSLLGNEALILIQERITSENINRLIASAFPVSEIDLLSIDIDYNDYWIWKAIEVVTPRVVVIEYNASWIPPASITVPYDADRKWNGTNYFGASLGALTKLGAEKGYALVGCTLSGVNAFFVRNDLLSDKFHAPGSAEEHYEPPRYYLCSLPSGHPPTVGPVETV